jgi:hypothetical protein
MQSPLHSGDATSSLGAPKRSREKYFLYGGIALVMMIIVALLTPYPTMILDNYQHVRDDLEDDDSATELALSTCSIRHAGLQRNSVANASSDMVAMQAGIINGEMRTDYYFDTEFATARTTASALVYNSPSSERGLLLYECPPGTELKGRWVRGGADGGERWLRLTMSRYVREDALGSAINADAENLRRANEAADAAAKTAEDAAVHASTPFAGPNELVGSDLILTTFLANIPLIDDGRPKCDIFADPDLKERVGAGGVLNDPNYEEWYLGIGGEIFDFTTQEGEGGYYQGDGYGVGIGIGGFYAQDGSKVDKGEVILVKSGVRTILPVYRRCSQ